LPPACQLADRYALVGHALEAARDARRGQYERDAVRRHDLADEQDPGVAVERQAQAIDLVVIRSRAGRSPCRPDRAPAACPATRAARGRDLDQALLQEAWFDLRHRL
jgi:hypothetical protein